MNLILTIFIAILALVVGGLLGYFFHRYQAEIALQDGQQKADSILKIANEQARLIETQARENAVKTRAGRRD